MRGPPKQKKAPSCVSAHERGEIKGSLWEARPCRVYMDGVGWTVKPENLLQGVAVGVPAAEPVAPLPLPCLNINNSNGAIPKAPSKDAQKAGKKTAFKLTETIKQMAAKYGVERLGFFTVTFPDKPTAKQASARMNNLNTGVLSERYEAWVSIYERANGRPHFHLLVVLPSDIRTGCNFEEFTAGDYRSAPQTLRDEWAFWRGVTNYNGKRGHLARYADIGRTELLPVKSTADGIRKYVGKYVEKHLCARLPEDKGVRLLRMSKGLSTMTVKFSWFSPGSRLWRYRVSVLAFAIGAREVDGLAGITRKLGSKWAWHLRHWILNAQGEEWTDGLSALAARHNPNNSIYLQAHTAAVVGAMLNIALPENR